MVLSPCLLRAATISFKNGGRPLEHSRSVASQITLSARATAMSYFLGRPRLLLVRNLWAEPNRRTDVFRWSPVTMVNSSRILPFSFLDAPTYRLRIASRYSRMLARVTLPSFLVTIFLRQRYHFR